MCLLYIAIPLLEIFIHIKTSTDSLGPLARYQVFDFHYIFSPKITGSFHPWLEMTAITNV